MEPLSAGVRQLPFLSSVILARCALGATVTVDPGTIVTRGADALPKKGADFRSRSSFGNEFSLYLQGARVVINVKCLVNALCDIGNVR